MDFLKKKDFSFTKRTNSEVANFYEQVLALLPVKLMPPVADETPTQYECQELGISNYMLETAYEVRDRMNNFVQQQVRKIETAPLQEQESVRDYYVGKLFNLLSVEGKSPVGELKEAARVLKVVAEPYKGMQRLPDNQETAQIRGLLMDLRKKEYEAHVETLGLSDLLSKLEEANEAFVSLAADRSASRLARKEQGTSKDVRLEVEKMYDNLTMLAQAKAVLEPTPEATAFIRALNNLIDETNAAYNLRQGIASANKSKKEEDNKGGEGWTPVGK